MYKLVLGRVIYAVNESQPWKVQMMEHSMMIHGSDLNSFTFLETEGIIPSQK